MLFEYIRSPYEIRMEEKSLLAALDLLVRYDIPFHGLCYGEKDASFRLYAPYYREYTARRGERRFAGEVRRRLGLIPYLARYKQRAGLFAGGLFALFLLIFSSLFVWDIRVTGNERIPEQAVIEALAEKGLTLGAFIPALDTERLEGEMALSLDGISFFSINLRGTAATVELREREPNTETVDTESPSNLVAKTDGQIEQMEITGGVIRVKHGQIVKKGELLVSGIIDSAALGYRTVRSRGTVTARTSMRFETEIPLAVTDKVYTGEVKVHRSLKIFSKILSFFRKEQFSEEFCDTIETERRLYLFDTIKLPLFLCETTYAFYEEIPRVLSEEEALALGKEMLREKRDAALSDAEILRRHTEVTMTDTALVLSETVDCIINIAEEVKLGTEP